MRYENPVVAIQQHLFLFSRQVGQTLLALITCHRWSCMLGRRREDGRKMGRSESMELNRMWRERLILGITTVLIMPTTWSRTQVIDTLHRSTPGMHPTFMHSCLESLLHTTCTLNVVRVILMQPGQLRWIGWPSHNSASGCLCKCWATIQLIICGTLVIRHFELALGHTRPEGNLMWIKSMQESELDHQRKEQRWNIIKQLWLLAVYARHWKRFVSISWVCTLTQVTTDYHVKLVELWQPGDAACVRRQCEQQQKGSGVVTNASFLTTVMNSLGYLGVTRRNWKGKMWGVGQHPTTMLYQRMRGR